MRKQRFKHVKISFILILSVFFYINVSAQTSTEDWILIKSKNDVSVFYKAGICSADSVIFIRIVNSNEHNTVVLWSLWGESTVNDFALTGNDDKIGECPDPANKGLTNDLIDFIPLGKTTADMIPNIILE